MEALSRLVSTPLREFTANDLGLLVFLAAMGYLLAVIAGIAVQAYLVRKRPAWYRRWLIWRESRMQHRDD